MKWDLLLQNVNSYKACLHTHTNLSEGHNTPEEIRSVYMPYGCFRFDVIDGHVMHAYSNAY